MSDGLDLRAIEGALRGVDSDGNIINHISMMREIANALVGIDNTLTRIGDILDIIAMPPTPKKKRKPVRRKR